MGSAPNGWTLYRHPLFANRFEELVQALEAEKARSPKTYLASDAAKRLAAVRKLGFDAVPRDPADKNFRLGGALGDANKNWCRAKFFQQYRLFFRFDSRSKVIVYAWLNDDDSLRADGSKSDAYRMFAKRLASGNPPRDFDALLKSAKRLQDG